jgi:hypothetical protein
MPLPVPLPIWLLTGAAVAVVIVVGLLAGRGRHPGPVRAGAWVGAYLTLAIAFGVELGMVAGADAAVRFFAGYLTECSLSVGNLFVFGVVMTSFAVPGRAAGPRAAHRHRRADPARHLRLPRHLLDRLVYLSQTGAHPGLHRGRTHHPGSPRQPRRSPCGFL